MNKIATTAVLAIAAALFTQGARGQSYNDDDLILGFNLNGGASDYVINLGSSSTIVGGSSVVDLSGSFNRSTFNSLWASPTGPRVGVVGGANSTSVDVFQTATRGGGVGASAAVKGSEAVPATINITTKSKLQGDLGALIAANLTLSTAGSSVVDSSKNYTSKIAGSTIGGTTTWWGQQSVNPQSTFDVTGIVYEDLFFGTAGGAYSYQGYFTIDLSGSSGSITFTPKDLVAVPEPRTYGIIAGAGLLWLTLRGKFGRNGFSFHS